jgi:hypothetical protein
MMKKRNAATSKPRTMYIANCVAMIDESVTLHCGVIAMMRNENDKLLYIYNK